MRIAIVTQYYPPERATLAPMLAHALKERGHEICVVTGFPNYPEGELFDGYKQRFGHTEDDNGIPVRRVPLVTSHSQNPLGRILNYFSFGISALTASRFTREADVVYVYATQMTAAIAPAWWRRVRKQSYVLHVQDLWPESITGSNMLPKWASHVASWALTPWLRRKYGGAAAVIGIAPTMTRTLTERGAPETSRTIFNWAAPAGVREIPSTTQPKRGLRLVYGGNIGEMQDLSTVLEAVGIAGDLPGFQVDIYGVGVLLQEVQARAAELGLKNVHFHGWVDRTVLARAYETADFALVPLKNLPIFEMTIPSKFQASMSAGLPVVTTARGDLADIVRGEGVGFSARPGDPRALAGVIREAHATTASTRFEMGKRARAPYETDMSMEVAVDSLEEALADASLARSTRKKRVAK